jgi:superoxide reductase
MLPHNGRGRRKGRGLSDLIENQGGKEMKFGDILKGQESEGKEKHVPVIEIMKGHGSEVADLVHVVVGKETPHPNTVEHHIAWLELFGVKGDGQVINLGRADFAPSYTNPNISFHAPVESFKAFCAICYCNIHGVWQNCIEV